MDDSGDRQNHQVALAHLRSDSRDDLCFSGSCDEEDRRLLRLERFGYSRSHVASGGCPLPRKREGAPRNTRLIQTSLSKGSAQPAVILKLYVRPLVPNL